MCVMCVVLAGGWCKAGAQCNIEPLLQSLLFWARCVTCNTAEEATLGHIGTHMSLLEMEYVTCNHGYHVGVGDFDILLFTI